MTFNPSITNVAQALADGEFAQATLRVQTAARRLNEHDSARFLDRQERLSGMPVDDPHLFTDAEQAEYFYQREMLLAGLRAARDELVMAERALDDAFGPLDDDGVEDEEWPCRTHDYEHGACSECASYAGEWNDDEEAD